MHRYTALSQAVSDTWVRDLRASMVVLWVTGVGSSTVSVVGAVT